MKFNIEKNIRGFCISMDEFICMKILHCTCCLHNNIHLDIPIKSAKCCLPMLYVWLIARVFMRKGSYKAKNPIEDFKMCKEVKKMNNKAVWIQHLSNLNGETIRWYPKWKEI
ncbi:hypothetical protein A2U01_0014056, partial [Trifolium medium]|nr:hypothetical protein [Trifolium medium]